MKPFEKIVLLIYAIVAVLPIWFIVFGGFDPILVGSYVLFWASFKGYNYAKSSRRRQRSQGKKATLTALNVSAAFVLNMSCCVLIIWRVIYLF